VAAHPDDEALGFAGIIVHARESGRRVRVAVVTNGDSERPGRSLPAGGARAGSASSTVRYGIRRARETVAAMGVLGLRFSRDPTRSDILLLGYRNNALPQIARSGEPWPGDPTGLRRTYAGAR